MSLDWPMSFVLHSIIGRISWLMMSIFSSDAISFFICYLLNT
jgi:hypothetical protein